MRFAAFVAPSAHPRSHLARVPVRRLVAAAGAGALLVPTLLIGVASAAGVKGDPQPDAKPFTVGGSTGAPSSVVASDGSLVTAFDIGNTTRVCRIVRGGRKCSSVAKLVPLDASADDFGVPQVFAPAADTIVVLQGTCCATDSNGTLLYTSTNLGKTFGAPVRVGNLGVQTGTLVGGNIVWTDQDDHNGLEVESTPAIGATGTPQASQIVESTAAAYDVGIGHVKGGVILGTDDDLPSSWQTTVRFAASGTNPGLAASYGVIGVFPNERLEAISGNAVLTELGDSHSTLRLRLFNGTTFTAPSAVPGGKGGGPEWFALDVDPSGLSHVFVETSRDSYDVFQVTTRDDVHWSAADVLGDAVEDNEFSAAIDKAGTGILFGTDAEATVYPILAPQKITAALSDSTVAAGATESLSGHVTPHLSGAVVSLQVEHSGLWSAVGGTSGESSTGAYKLTVPTTTAGTFVYRAVVKGEPGHYLYGYSSPVTLTVT